VDKICQIPVIEMFPKNTVLVIIIHVIDVVKNIAIHHFAIVKSDKNNKKMNYIKI